MLKKLITIAFILVFASQAYCQEMREMTPLQKRVRAIFSEIRNRDKVVPVEQEPSAQEIAEAEEVIEEVNSYSAQPEENRTEIIMASEQDQDETEEYEEGEGEEEIVVATAPKSECENKAVEEKKEYSDVITAADASSKDRTAKINNKWSVEALGWNSELDGHIKIAENKDALAVLNDADGRIDLKSDTSLDKKKVPGLKLAYRHGGRASFEFNWVNVEQDGHLNNGLNKTFRGKVYAADANFKINNEMYDLVWKYRFTHKVEETGREKSYVAGLFGIKASKMEFTFDGNATENGVNIGNHHESKSETIPVPYLGVEGGTYLGENLYLKGYFRYLKLNNIKDYDAEHADYDVSLSYKLSNKDGNQDIFFDVGYRQVVYDVEGKGNDVELKYKGPYVGLEFRF